MEFYNEWIKAKNDIISDQARRYENEIANEKRIQKLNKEFDLVQAAFDQLSDEQKAMLKAVPRTKEEWEEFNEIGEDMDKKEERLEEIWTEIDKVVNDMPFDSEQLNIKFKQIAAELAQKYHLNN